MKSYVYFLACALILSLAFSSCEKDENTNTDPDIDPTGEQLPPDNDPVSGTITGIISEIAYDEAISNSVVSINRIPHTLAKFLELRNQIAAKPQGAVVMMLVAMRIYQQYPVEGMKCLTAACTSPLVVTATTNPGAYEGYVMGNISELKLKLESLSYLPFVYYQGASPSNKYTPSAPPYVTEMLVNQYSYIESNDGSTRIKVFVKTLGADSPRPVTVRKIGDYYRITEYSSLYLAPKPPQ
jgi:hypothetical protein